MIFLARSQRWLDLFATCAVTTAIALTGAQRIVLVGFALLVVGFRRIARLK